MQLPPLSVLQSLPAPNYVNPETHPPAASIVNLVLYPLCVVVMVLRAYSRIKVSHSFGADDALAISAMLPATAFCVISVLAELKYGWVRHVQDVPPNSITLGLQLILTAECLFAAGCTLTKLSMLMFVRRMMENTNTIVRKTALAAMLIIGGQGITFCFVVIFQCRPVSDYWKLSMEPQPNCFNQPANLLAAGIVNTLTDFVVVLIPIPIVLKLKLPFRQQIVMVMLFGTGFLVCIAGALRTYYMYEVSTTYDQTWVGFKVWVSGAAEFYLAILCCSLPALKPFFTRYVPRFLESFPGTLSSSKRRSTLKIGSANITGTNTSTVRSSGMIELDSMHYQSMSYDAWGKPTKRDLQVREVYPSLGRQNTLGESSDDGDLESQGGMHGIEVRREWAIEESRAHSQQSDKRLVD